MSKQGDPRNPKSPPGEGGAKSEKSKQQGRRRVSVEGEQPAIEMPKKAQQRSLQEILGDPAKGAEDAPKAEGPVWDPKRLEAFLRGRITLGDLEGITKHEQYEMAKIGFSYLSSGKLDQAKVVFEGLVALDPYDAYFHTALGSIAQQKNDLPEAEARYSRALEINPFSPVALANRGEVRVVMGRLGEGAADLVRALEEDPNAVQPSTIRARATIQVVREQLEKLNLADKLPPPSPKQQTGSKVPVAKAQTGSKVPVAAPAGTGSKVTVATVKAQAPAAAAPAAKKTGEVAKPVLPGGAAAAKKTGEVAKPEAAAKKTGEVAKPTAAAKKTGEVAKPKDDEPKAARALRPPPRRPPPKKK